MTSTSTITCEFCSTLNPDGNTHCLACGAPLSKAPKPTINPAESASPIPQPAMNPASMTGKTTTANQQMQQARQIGEQVEDVGRKALYAYSLLWRTLAEAAAIAITGFGIGLIGGATGTAFWGVLGAAGVGLGVGLAIKITTLALFSAPVGLVIGAVIGLLPFVLGGGVKVFVFTTSIFAFLAAVLGGRPFPYSQRNLYEKLRPFIGAAGGLVFGLLGMLVGLGLRAAVNALLVPV
jgi:hypothetical protein